MKCDGLLRTGIRPDEPQILIKVRVIYPEVTLNIVTVTYKLWGAKALPRPHGCIGETKLKILAIIYHDGASHGYGVWMTLKESFHCYLDDPSLRNVYHHLHDLEKLDLVERSLSETGKNAPKNHGYKLTDKGKMLGEKFKKYMDVL